MTEWIILGTIIRPMIFFQNNRDTFVKQSGILKIKSSVFIIYWFPKPLDFRKFSDTITCLKMTIRATLFSKGEKKCNEFKILWYP